MRNLHGATACALGLALLIGCGGGGATTATSTTSTTTSTTGAATTGTATTGGTSTGMGPAAGSYSGTYGSVTFNQGGPGTTGPSGNSTLVISSTGTLTLTLGDQTVTGTLSSNGTSSDSFTGTFTYDVTGGGTATASVTGTAVEASPRITVRFSNYTDSSHANGTTYTATLS